MDGLRLPPPPVDEWGDARRKLARQVATDLLDMLQEKGFEPERLEEIEAILKDSGMLGCQS